MAWALRLAIVLGVTLLAHLSFLAYTLNCFAWTAVLVGFVLMLTQRTVSAALNFVTGVLCVMGLHSGFTYRHRQLELDAAPVIAAVEDFRRSQGRYPKDLSELPASVWAGLPEAAPKARRWQGAGDVSCWYFEPDKGRPNYGITCGTLIFLKHTYDPARRRWYSWD